MVIQIRKSNRSLNPVVETTNIKGIDNSAAQANLDNFGNTVDKAVNGIKNVADFNKRKEERELEFNNASALDGSNTADANYAAKKVGIQAQVESGEIAPDKYITELEDLRTETDNEFQDSLENTQQKDIYNIYRESQKDRDFPADLEYQARAVSNFKLKATADTLEERYKYSDTVENDESLTNNYEKMKAEYRVANPNMSPEQSDSITEAGYANYKTTSLSAEGRVNPEGAMRKATYNLNKGWISQEQYDEIYDTTISPARYSEVDLAGNVAYKRYGDDQASAYAEIEASVPYKQFEDNKEYTDNLIQDKKDAYDRYRINNGNSNRSSQNKVDTDNFDIIREAIYNPNEKSTKAGLDMLGELAQGGEWKLAEEYGKMLTKSINQNPKLKDTTEEFASALLTQMIQDEDGLTKPEAKTIYAVFGDKMADDEIKTVMSEINNSYISLTPANEESFNKQFKTFYNITESGDGYKYNTAYYKAKNLLNEEIKAKDSVGEKYDFNKLVIPLLNNSGVDYDEKNSIIGKSSAKAMAKKLDFDNDTIKKTKALDKSEKYKVKAMEVIFNHDLTNSDKKQKINLLYKQAMAQEELGKGLGAGNPFIEPLSLAGDAIARDIDDFTGEFFETAGVGFKNIGSNIQNTYEGTLIQDIAQQFSIGNIISPIKELEAIKEKIEAPLIDISEASRKDAIKKRGLDIHQADLELKRKKEEKIKKAIGVNE